MASYVCSLWSRLCFIKEIWVRARGAKAALARRTDLSEVRRLAMAGATEGGLSAVLLVLIVSLWLPDRYRQDGAEAPSLLIAITPLFARRSPFGVREHSTPADLCKQVEQIRDLSPVRLHLTLRPPISTSVHHLLSGNCDAQSFQGKN